MKFLRHIRRALREFSRFLDSLFTFSVFKIASKTMPNVFITCDRHDGGGAQLHGRISVFAFCKKFGFSYVHTKIRNAHFSDGEDWDRKWNALFKFKDFKSDEVRQSRIIKTATTADLRREILKLISSLHFLEPVLFQMESAHLVTNDHPRIMDDIREEIRNCFQSTPYPGNEKIVIHLRRGDDITADQRFESNQTLNARLKRLCELFPEHKIRIYTNAPLVLQKEFSSFATVDFDTSPFQAISHMVDAEVLIIAKSSMSYIAGLVSHQKVYAPDFWHPLMPDWLNASVLNRSSL